MSRRIPKKQGALVSNAKYAGRYVVFESAESSRIIASGTSPSKLIKKARDKGIAVPAIVFVPRKNAIFAY